MSRYLARYGRYPAWKNTAAQYFACGEAMYPQLLQDLERAEHTIFVEYFIVHTGKMWDGVEAILRRKAAQGVDVRLIYDDFGSLLGLPTDFVVRMERAHIRCIPFNPVVPVLSLVMNHRDHRKIVVIDGRIAYTGGVNLADEYINAEQRFGYWKDAALRIEGDAAWNFTVMFLNFWNAFRLSETDYSAFRPQHSAHPVQDGIVQPYADSPLDEEPVAETVYLNLLARAEQYVYIYTPYLAVGEEMLDALKNGKIAGAGLDVYEEETEFFFEDRSEMVKRDTLLSLLVSMPNVVLTSHQAFLTNEALHNIAQVTLENLDAYFQDGTILNQVQ